MQAMTKTADKVSEKAVPVTEKVAGKIEDKAAQVRMASSSTVARANAKSAMQCCAMVLILANMFFMHSLKEARAMPKRVTSKHCREVCILSAIQTWGHQSV